MYMFKQFSKMAIPIFSPHINVWEFQLSCSLTNIWYHLSFLFQPLWWIYSCISLWFQFVFPLRLIKLNSFSYLHWPSGDYFAKLFIYLFFYWIAHICLGFTITHYFSRNNGSFVIYAYTFLFTFLGVKNEASGKWTEVGDLFHFLPLSLMHVFKMPKVEGEKSYSRIGTREINFAELSISIGSIWNVCFSNLIFSFRGWECACLSTWMSIPFNFPFKRLSHLACSPLFFYSFLSGLTYPAFRHWRQRIEHVCFQYLCGIFHKVDPYYWI